VRIGVADANIFIDIILLSLESEFFKLPLEIWTTESVLLELKDEQNDSLEKYIKLGSLIVEDHSIDSTLTFSNALSIPDQSVLSLSYTHKAICLSGDKPVRKWCADYNIEVHGILWILDQFINHQICSSAEAHRCLVQLMSINDRLPDGECAKRLNEWASK
jgi:predicted nucleic acid-binding protein